MYIVRMDNENQSFIPVPKKDLEAIQARTAKRILNITEKSIAGLETLLQRIDGVDDALARAVSLQNATPQELYAYFNQIQQSFRLRQDFVKSLAGYEVDTSHVPVEADDKFADKVLNEDEAERVRQEILSRTLGTEVHIE